MASVAYSFQNVFTKASQGNGEGRNEFEGLVGSSHALHLVLEAGRAFRSKVRRTHVETDLENSKARHGHSDALLQNSDSRESRNSRNSRDSRALGRNLSPSSLVFMNLEMAAALLPLAVSAGRLNGPGKES